MKITLNPNTEHVKEIRNALKDNDNYCPCSIIRSESTKCMCQDFINQKENGYCHCKLYFKQIKKGDNN